MKIPVKKSIIIPEGEHVGVIVETNYRERQFNYVDVIIEFPIGLDKVKLKSGFPSVITERSSLGLLLFRCGAKLTPGEEIDPDDYLIGKKVKFSTIIIGNFAEIVRETIRPYEFLKEFIDEEMTK
jgi:hypothetical protein